MEEVWNEWGDGLYSVSTQNGLVRKLRTANIGVFAGRSVTNEVLHFITYSFPKPGTKLHRHFCPIFPLKETTAQLKQFPMDCNRFFFGSGGFVELLDKSPGFERGGTENSIPRVFRLLERIPIFVADPQDTFLAALRHGIENGLLFVIAFLSVVHFPSDELEASPSQTSPSGLPG
jgi:hypothetical protein